MGTKQGVVSEWETGKVTIKRVSAVMLAAALETTVEHIYGISEGDEPPRLTKRQQMLRLLQQARDNLEIVESMLADSAEDAV